MDLATKRDQEARKTLDDFQGRGAPFVLLLRTYSMKMDPRQNFQNVVYDMLLGNCGVISIRGSHPIANQEENESDPELRARCPALIVKDNEWTEVARRLIRDASFVACEVWQDTPGVSIEVTACRDGGRIDDTIIMLPKTANHKLTNLDIFNQFWRIVLFEDLGQVTFHDHPATRDLLMRLPGLQHPNFFKPATFGEVVAEKEFLASRGGMPILIPDLLRLARAHLDRKNLRGATVHCQNAWNIAVRLAQLGHRITPEEYDGVVAAGTMLADLSRELGDLSAAMAKIDAVTTIAKAQNLLHRIPEICHVRSKIESA